MKALVLKKSSYGESDLILRVLSESGKVCSVFAPGGNRSQKRFPHRFHMSGIYELEIRDEDRLSRLRTCELVEYFPDLEKNIENWSRWMTVAEWMIRHEQDVFSFSESLNILANLSHGSLPSYYSFFREQIRHHGINASWEECILCHKAVVKPFYFSWRHGGLCHKHDETCEPIDGAAVQYLKGEPVDHPSPDLDRILIPFLETHLGSEIRSYRFLRSLSLG